MRQMTIVKGHTAPPAPLYLKPIRLHMLACPRKGCKHVVSVTEDRWLVPAISTHIAVAHWPEGLRVPPHFPQEVA